MLLANRLYYELDEEADVTTAQAERARIVSWIRGQADEAAVLNAPWVPFVRNMANRIEDGDYLPNMK